MGCAGNAVVARNSPATFSIRRSPALDGGSKSIGELNRTLLIMLQLGDDSGYGLVQFFLLAQGFTVILDYKSSGDAKEDDEQLAR